MSLLSPQLEAFLAIVDQKTVHGAALKIHLTQTAVTQRIRALERKLKTSLFIRTRRGMELTEEGHALLHYCQIIKGMEGEALAKISGRSLDSVVSIGITGPTSIMSSRIIPNCLAVSLKHPNLLLNFNVYDFEDAAKFLKSGETQFIIVQPHMLANELQSKLLRPEKYVLVCSPLWKGKNLNEIIKNERIIDFNVQDQMTFNYLRHFNLIQNSNYERHFVNHTQALAEIIKQGLGYSVLTEEFSRPYVQKGELHVMNSNKIYEHSLCLAWYDRGEAPEYFKGIIDAIE